MASKLEVLTERFLSAPCMKPSEYTQSKASKPSWKPPRTEEVFLIKQLNCALSNKSCSLLFFLHSIYILGQNSGQDQAGSGPDQKEVNFIGYRSLNISFNLKVMKVF